MKKRITKFLVMVFVVIALVGGIDVAMAVLSKPRVEYVEVPEQKKAVAEIVKETAEAYDISPLVLMALIRQESGKGMRTDRIRYEAHLQRKFKRAGWMNDAEYRTLASSFGLTQVVYGLHKKTCGLNSYADLLDPETNVRCGALVLDNRMQRHKGVKDPVLRLRRALGCYNGDPNRYPNNVMLRMAELVIEGMPNN